MHFACLPRLRVRLAAPTCIAGVCRGDGSRRSQTLAGQSSGRRVPSGRAQAVGVFFYIFFFYFLYFFLYKQRH